MSLLFNRYSPPARKAVFYAHVSADNSGAQEISSDDLLAGLLAEPSTRADQIFELEKSFPEDALRVRSFAVGSESGNPQLQQEVKRILNYACQEADRMNEYWIDTDHLVLGILREGRCAAALRLRRLGIDIKGSRKLVTSLARTELYGPSPMLWKLAIPIGRTGRFAGILYLVGILVLIKILAERHC